MNPLNVRKAFVYDKIINWFPGHMAKGLRLITEKLSTVHVIIEVRDARIPLSSINHKFEPIAQRKDRLIVYNKSDLAHPSTEAVRLSGKTPPQHFLLQSCLETKKKRVCKNQRSF